MSVTSRRPTREQVRAALNGAFDVAPDERRAFLEERLPAGETLDAAISLLAEVEDVGDFMERPLVVQDKEFRPPVPAYIGGYRIERLLGFGSMGVVYLAEQESPRRPVAVKVLRLDAASPRAAERFAREGELLARLSHAGIASVYEAGVADLGAGPQPFLAMEYVPGAPITEHADRAGLSRRERVELVWRVALAVAHAHDQGVLHRDLKPENVLVRENGEPVVLDLGVGQRKADDDLLHLTATGQILGTVSYMAPEQARGGTVDERVDQFALGAILYELLTGELPLAVRGRLPHEALRVVADGDWTPPSRHVPELAGDLEAVLATALASEPQQRYPSVEAFASDLERWLSGRPVVARPPTWHGVLASFVRRNKALSVWVLVGLLTTGGASTWAMRAALELRRGAAVSLLFSDLQLMVRLQEESERLWPTSSAVLPSLQRWVEDGEGLAGRLPEHRARLARVSARNDAGLAADERWRRHERAELVRQLESLTAEDGLLAEMRARRDQAAELRARTVDEPAEAWRAAARRVAADERFDGLTLRPQEGLVPLGPDPASHLEEFALWGSGTLPRRDPETDRFAPRAEHAIVLVLVPGGDCLIGAQNHDPVAPNYSEEASVPPIELGHEGPPFRIRLDPYLISKYELTQAQWLRAFGQNPSDWEDGTVIEGNHVTALHPVESMCWEDTCRLLPHLGLTLPTEAQWEAAARGGTSLPYVQGRSFYDLIGYTNWNTGEALPQELKERIPDDGYYTHSPVGTWKPNPYGLHDTLGNVWELCLDNYKLDYHELPHRPGDGLVLAEPDGDVSRRGQGLFARPPAMRVDFRGMKRFDGRDALTGVRPARALVVQASRTSAPGEAPSGE